MKSPLIPLLALTLTVSGASLAAADTGPATPTSPSLQRYQAANKHALQLPVPAGERVVEVKFAHAIPVEAGDGRVRAQRSEQDSSGALALLRSADVASSQPLFVQPRAELQRLKVEAEKDSGVEQSDLSQWVAVTAKDHEAAKRLAEKLNASPDVEVAYVRPKSVSMREGAPKQAVAAASEDLTRFQGYLGDPSSSYGINAHFAHTIEGGAGKGVTIGDTEIGWVYDHEDLSKLTTKSIVTNGTPTLTDNDHGTNVAGEMIADKNGFGVTGIAYDANMIVSHAETKERGFDPANGVATLIPHLKKGDVLVVELQTPGCSGSGGRGGYVAEEWIPSVYDAIKSATSKGIYVVEAAGNGGENLDAGCYGKRFPNDRDDSGAIIVGAGAGKDTSGKNRYCGKIGDRQMFSTYGTRVNSFGWGLCVTTTGARGYTHGFSGTSSATPIVAGAVASIAGIAKARGIELTPVQMRELLSSTGTPSDFGAKIGTMPDLKKAIANLGGVGSTPKPTSTPTASASPTASATPAPTTSATPTASATPTSTPTSNPDPAPGPFDCAKLKNQVQGSVGAGREAVVPQGGFLFSRGGKQKACLSGTNGLDADLRVETWGLGGWKAVAETSGANDQLEFDGGMAFYRIVVVSRNNTAGNFRLSYELV